MTTSDLRDAEVLRTYFFAPGYERDPEQLRAVELGRLFTHAAEELDPKAPAIDLTVSRLPGSVRLAEVPFHPRGSHGSQRVRLEARTLHDSYMLTTTVLVDGPIATGTGPPVGPHIPAVFGGLASNRYLGKVTIHAAEAPATATPADLAALASEHAKRCGLPVDSIPAATDHAAVVIDPDTPAAGIADTLGPRCVVVYRQGADVKQFVRIDLPELFLYHLKARVLYHDVWMCDFVSLRDNDEKIRALIKSTAQPSTLTLDALLTANDDITTHLADLVAGISDVENRLHTGAIAETNFTKAVRECGFPPTEQAALTAELVGRWVSALTEQGKAALAYRCRTRDVAQVHFASLQATVEAHESRETRKLAIVMALLTCAQVAGVAYAAIGDDVWKGWLGEDFTKTTAGFVVRLGVVAITTGALFAAAWWRWLGRRARRRR